MTDTQYITSFQQWLDKRGGSMLSYIVWNNGQISFTLIPPKGMTAEEALTRFDKEYTDGRRSKA